MRDKEWEHNMNMSMTNRVPTLEVLTTETSSKPGRYNTSSSSSAAVVAISASSVTASDPPRVSVAIDFASPKASAFRVVRGHLDAPEKNEGTIEASTQATLAVITLKVAQKA